MQGTVLAFILMASAFASASQVILNPGDINNYGVALSCEPVGSNPPPPPPPPPPPRLVGYYHTDPNMQCLQGTPRTDPQTIDGYVRNCGFRNDANLFCNSTQNVGSSEDGNCFNVIYARETEPGAIHPDQMAELHAACTVTTIACYQN